MKKISTLFLVLYTFSAHAQNYFPDADWQIKKPEELKMNKVWLDSAVSFAMKMKTKLNVTCVLPI